MESTKLLTCLTAASYYNMCFRGGVHPATQGVFSSYFLQCQEIPTEYIMLSLKQGFPFSIIYIWFFPQKLEKLVELTLFKKT
jgi:hypothetical protein